MAFKRAHRAVEGDAGQPEAQPDALFDDALDAALSPEPSARAAADAGNGGSQMNLDKSLAFYKDRFADASDFTFVFVGSFDLEAMKPLVERYLGSLPSLRRNEMVKDVGIRPPTGVVERQVKSGIAPRSQVSIVFTGPFQNDEQHRVIARRWPRRSPATCSGRCARIWAAPTASAWCRVLHKRPDRRSTRVTITFACDPARSKASSARCSARSNSSRRAGRRRPVGGSAAGARARPRNEQPQRSCLLNQLTHSEKYGEDPGEVFRLPQFYEQLTAAAIRDAAQMYWIRRAT